MTRQKQKWMNKVSTGNFIVSLFIHCKYPRVKTYDLLLFHSNLVLIIFHMFSCCVCVLVVFLGTP